MRDDWTVVLYILYIFVFMLIAKLIKEKLGIFKSIIIPNALLAGLLGLLAGPEVLGIINFEIKFYSNEKIQVNISKCFIYHYSHTMACTCHVFIT